MYKPGDIIRARGPISLAYIRYDERPVRSVFPTASASANTDDLALVICSTMINMDGDRTNELYVMLFGGRQGWTYGELWRSITWVKFTSRWSNLKL